MPNLRTDVPSSQHSRQHDCDLLGGGFQTVQGGVTPGCERGVAGRASKCLDPLGLAMLAISDEGMDVRISDPGVGALLVGTSEALGGYSLGGSPTAFHLTPGAYWRRGRSHAWQGETTDGAIKRCAGLEQTVQPTDCATS